MLLLVIIFISKSFLYAYKMTNEETKEYIINDPHPFLMLGIAIVVIAVIWFFN